MNKSSLFALALTLGAASAFAQNGQQTIDKVVAAVGQEIVLLSEVEEQFAYAATRQANVPQEYKCSILQELMIQKLLINQARLDSVTVTDQDIDLQVDARFERIVQQMGGDESRFEEFYGAPITVMREQIRGDMKNQMIAEKMQRQIIEAAKISPTEVQAFFANIPKDSLPYFNSEVEIREIFYRPKINAAEKQKARDQAEALRKRIVEGKEDFATLAKKYSDDPGSGLAGGDLGFAKRGAYVPEFEAAVYNLEKDEVSSVVESPFGFHVIQLLERRGNSVHARHILIKPKLAQSDLKAASETLDSVRAEIGAGKLTFSAAVKKYGDKNAQSFHNDGRVTNAKSGNTYFELADLDTDVYFAIDNLEVGKLTAPIESKGEDGEKYYRIIQLASRSKPHKANLKQDYSKIQQAALEHKKSNYMQEWMTEKSKSTFIHIDPLFSDCPNLKGLQSSSSDN